jgi:hypothetical protein
MKMSAVAAIESNGWLCRNGVAWRNIRRPQCASRREKRKILAYNVAKMAENMWQQLRKAISLAKSNQRLSLSEMSVA